MFASHAMVALQPRDQTLIGVAFRSRGVGRSSRRGRISMNVQRFDDAPLVAAVDKRPVVIKTCSTQPQQQEVEMKQKPQQRARQRHHFCSSSLSPPASSSTSSASASSSTSSSLCSRRQTLSAVVTTITAATVFSTPSPTVASTATSSGGVGVTRVILRTASITPDAAANYLVEALGLTKLDESQDPAVAKGEEGAPLSRSRRSFTHSLTFTDINGNRIKAVPTLRIVVVIAQSEPPGQR